jgi:hypothetical protein
MPLKDRVAAVLAAAALASCGGPREAISAYPVAFVVESDPGIRLRGARVAVGGDLVGVSDSQGLVRANLSGLPGERWTVTHDCPDGHEAPGEPKFLRMRESARVDTSDSSLLEITLRCDPATRLAGFVVRAKNGPDLPVLLNGQLVARTNRSGVAHFSVHGAARTEYSVELDTRDRPQLRPQAPTHLFTLPEAHEIFIVEQSFDLKSQPRHPRHRRPRITKIE